MSGAGTGCDWGTGEQWLNDTYHARTGAYGRVDQVKYGWANLIAAKEVGKIVGTLLLPLFENTGRRTGLLINNVIVFIGCYLCYVGVDLGVWAIMLGRFLLGETRRIITYLQACQ